MRFWLTLGCDGFRVDMAGSLVKNDEDKKETIRLWQDVRAFLNKEFPEAALVSEWGKPEVALEAGFDMVLLSAFWRYRLYGSVPGRSSLFWWRSGE